MPSLSLKIDHALTREEALDRLQRVIEAAKMQYGQQVSDLVERWDGHHLDFAFRAMGFSTSGKLVVEESHIQIESKLPLAAALFKGRIEDAIRGQLTRFLT